MNNENETSILVGKIVRGLAVEVLKYEGGNATNHHQLTVVRIVPDIVPVTCRVITTIALRVRTILGTYNWS